MKLTAVSTFLLLCVAGGVAQFNPYGLFSESYENLRRMSINYGVTIRYQGYDSLPTILSDDLKLSLSVIPSNMFSNGDFTRMGHLRYPRFYSTWQVPGWEFNGVAEIGPGRIYNRFWGNNVYVAELATIHDVSYHLPIRASPGSYYMAFDWAPRQGVAFSSSQIDLRWNGLHIIRLSTSYHAIFTQSIGFQSVDPFPRKILTFTGIGGDDTLGATITNARFFQTPNHFFGKFANFGSYEVANLIKEGHYYLGDYPDFLIVFDFVPQKTREPSESHFTVYVDYLPKLKLIPNSYRPRREFFKLKNPDRYFILKFKGQGEKNVLGHTVTNVRAFAQHQFVEGRYEITDFPGKLAS